VQVEIQDAQGKPLPGYALEDAVEQIGDEIERTVSWKGGSDISKLAGQPVKLRFVMKDADVFAIQVKRQHSSQASSKVGASHADPIQHPTTPAKDSVTMTFNIVSHQGAGGIQFGHSREKVRQHLQAPFESFKRTPESLRPCDYFESLNLFVYYGENGAEAIELAPPAAVSFQGKNLLQLSFADLTKHLSKEDKELDVDDDGCTSLKLGIGAYAPEAKDNPAAKSESIIVFAKGYYD
jgi:hypothetical protein